AYGKKGHYRIQGDPVEDLGTQFRQFVTYNDIYVYYTWTDRAEEYEECEGEGEDEECETRWHHPHVNGKIESYDVSEENSKPARVAVPYNFDTEIETNAYGNPSITYPGSEFRVEVSGSVESAKNNNRGKTYTTATPENSRVEVAQFILSPDASFTSAFEGNDNYNGNPAAYAGSLGGMQIISDTLESGSLEPGGFGAWERSSVVPDVETGSKICTVAGVYPTDSHGTPGQSKSGGYKKDDPGMEGFLKNGGAGWRISGVTCRTIVKKPSFQAWSGGIYSGTGIETSVTDKCLNSTLQWSSDSNCSKRIFGSWSEYEAISGYGSIRGLGSGAGFGYTWGVDTYGNGGRPGGYDSTAFNNSYYNVSHLSIANNNASGSGSSSSTGYSNISLNGEVLQRILSRYSSTTAGYNGCSFGYIDEGQVLAQSNRLVVLRCDGNVNINSDIIIGDRTYTKIDQLPQVVIIANNINISSNVTRLDAWLIATSRDAESTGSADGNINTCSDFVPSQTPSDGACSSKLVVNGPVIAGKVYLNRTYGALPGDGSIEPAEVFNLRADTYLWAYSQSEDYHQVITTYSRELAPRY
ncbi:hypothetical protein IKG16_00005, partial [Candidatus Saccharibacteria bacterium]|nr:hypothetical protein [Candidatus Saccharibacteria bacterium]